MATFNERMARAFMDKGHDVTLFTFSLQYPSILFPGKTQYADEPAPGGLDIRVRINSINPFNWISVGREISRLRPDLLIIRYWMPFMAPCLGTIARVVKKNGHTRVVAITDNVLPHEKQPGSRQLTRFFVRHNHGFVTLSQSVRDDLVELDVDPDAITVCPHPLYDNFGEPVSPPKAREQLQLPANPALVLFFGFIREYKGLDLLLEAFAHERMRDVDARLLVAGEFYDKPATYRQLAKELDIEEKIIWHSHFIPNDQVRWYFSAADLVVQPYKRATQSGVTQVAYHFERPMVVTNVGGLPEMVSQGRAGYVVEPDPGEIAGAMADFFLHRRAKDLHGTLKEEKKRFSWDKLVDSLLHIADKTT